MILGSLVVYLTHAENHGVQVVSSQSLSSKRQPLDIDHPELNLGCHLEDWLLEEGSESTITEQSGSLSTAHDGGTQDWHHHRDHRPCGIYFLMM